MTALEKYSPVLFLLMWSSGAIFVKLGLEDASVSVFLAVRSIGAALVLLLVCVLAAEHRGTLQRIKLPRKVICKALGIGLVLQVAYQGTYFLALDHHLTPGVLAIILGLQPILTPLFAREKIGMSGVLFLLLGLAGLAIAVVGAKEMGAITSLGLAFGLASVLAISIGSVLQKKSTIDPVVSAFYQSLGASLVFVVIMPFTQVSLTLTAQFLLSAGWMIFVVSTLAVLLLFHMLTRHSASKVSVLFYLVPVITLVLDYLAFGHKISAITVLGAALVVVAIKGFSQVQTHLAGKLAT